MQKVSYMQAPIKTAIFYGFQNANKVKASWKNPMKNFAISLQVFNTFYEQLKVYDELEYTLLCHEDQQFYSHSPQVFILSAPIYPFFWKQALNH